MSGGMEDCAKKYGTKYSAIDDKNPDERYFNLARIILDNCVNDFSFGSLIEKLVNSIKAAERSGFILVTNKEPKND
jgi:hypothetical protein